MKLRLTEPATLLGVAMGLMLAAIGACLLPSSQGRTPGTLIPDAGEPLRTIVLHYRMPASGMLDPVYRDLLESLRADTRVLVVGSTPSDRRAWNESLGPLVRSDTRFVVTGLAHSPWSRDRWVGLEAERGAGIATILQPARQPDGWAYAADNRLGGLIAERSRDSSQGWPRALTIRTERSPLLFDGGDFVCDKDTIFAAGRIIDRNVSHTVASAEELRLALEAQLGKRVVLLEGSPDHHAGMFMMPIGGRRVLVGDPSLGEALAPSAGGTGEPGWPLPTGPDFSSAMQARFDSVAEQCARAGYEVTRIPVVPGKDSRAWLTYVNVILDGPTALVPVFDGAKALNAAACKVWQDAGYTVRPINCTSTYRNGGSLRCLVNVLARG